VVFNLFGNANDHRRGSQLSALSFSRNETVGAAGALRRDKQTHQDSRWAGLVETRAFNAALLCRRWNGYVKAVIPRIVPTRNPSGRKAFCNRDSSLRSDDIRTTQASNADPSGQSITPADQSAPAAACPNNQHRASSTRYRNQLRRYRPRDGRCRLLLSRQKANAPPHQLLAR
jgi:hypothetical protein